MPQVIVTFYDNFRQENSAVGVNVTNGEPANYTDGKGFAHHRYKFRVVADSGTYRIGVVSDAYNKTETPETRFTAPIAWDADAATIAAALNAVAETIGTPFEWVAVADEPELNRHELDVTAAVIGSIQKLPEGFEMDDSALGGHLVWAWDEISYETDLVQGGCAAPEQRGEVAPEGESSGRVPTVRRVQGARVGEPKKQESVLPGEGRRSPN